MPVVIFILLGRLHFDDFRKKPTEIVPYYLLPISAWEKSPAPPTTTACSLGAGVRDCHLKHCTSSCSSKNWLIGSGIGGIPDF
jgi:hypothetical protein